MELLAQTDDAELMRLCALGNEPAFEELVRRYQDVIFSYFCRCGANRSDAEDLAQETFIKIYRSAANYRPTARFTTYLYTVGRNCWIDFTRRIHRRLSTTEWNDEVMIFADQPSPEKDAEGGELELNFREALKNLPDKHREALMLSESQGLRYAEIAEILEIPLGTVKSRIFNAIRMLRESMQKRGFHSRQ